ncbi:MAG: carbohydrate ABC transporter substrate-binding protein [Lachnospiraceae bacterium]|nr:carbohydrate ABC transporter substrate-binding protein [Lachnospiraceae bacterium]
MKKLVLWILEISLMFGMAACSPKQSGKTDDSISENSTVQNSAGTEKTENAESEMQYAYSTIIIDFMEYGSDVVVHDIAGRGDQVYVLLEVREWGEEPEDNTQKEEFTSYYQVFSCLADGSRKTVSEKIYLPEDGGYVSTMQLSDDGCVAALFYSDTENAVSLLFWDGFQDVHWEKTAASGGYLFFGEDGFVILARNGDGRMVNTYNAQGELTGSVEADGNIFSNFQNCYIMPDNRLLVIATDNAGMAYAEFYDIETGQEERRELPDNFFQYQVFQGTMADVLLCDSVGVYQLESGKNVPAEMLSYVDADLDIGGFQMVQQIDETRLAGIFNDGGTVKLGLFGRIAVPAGEQKQIVVLGTMDELGAGLRSRIIAFNRENSRYRITVRQYVTYNEEMSALMQLNTDILSGRMPDILLIDEEMPLQSYIEKGLLADVGKLLEEDAELDGGQFMENVFDAFRVNGTLYYVVPAFSVDTLVAKQSKVGERTGWNQEEFSAVLAGLPEGTEMVSETSRYDYLENYMRVCGREYIDMDQGTCDFQSAAFVEALRFAATLPEFAEDYFYEENSYGSQYLEDRALLQPVTIRYIPYLAQQIYGCMGEDIAYVGYPSESREGSCINICGVGFVLSGKSDKPDGAWEFVRYFLTEDFQRNQLYGIEGSGLPTRRDIFDEKAQIAATWEGYCFINDEFVSVPPMTQEQIDRAVHFIEGLHNPAFADEVIMNIIYEEAESFFQGQKSAEDVAGLIQNRVQLYLHERM